MPPGRIRHGARFALNAHERVSGLVDIVLFEMTQAERQSFTGYSDNKPRSEWRFDVAYLPRHKYQRCTGYEVGREIADSHHATFFLPPSEAGKCGAIILFQSFMDMSGG